jgi:hypothetical protein
MTAAVRSETRRVRRPRPRRLLIAGVVAGCLAAPTAVAGPTEAIPRVAADPAVITTWNTIAGQTIFPPPPAIATPIPSSALYFGFVSIAMYDAVATIEGGFDTYADQPRPHAHASPEVAAATAAYRVLLEYFPGAADRLHSAYAASLAKVPNGVGKVHGKRIGEDAAAAVIAARVGDGRNADHPLNVTPAPGVWRPTPPANAPMLVPWLGFVRPLTLTSPSQFALPGPDPLTSAAYATDFAEVKAYGRKDGSSRSPGQTETALFFNSNAVLQYQEGMRTAVTERGLDILDSAWAFALLGTSTADSLIACWRAKYDYAYWRPITAIRLADTDDNPATERDLDWEPLVATPPYGDYVSGHACITGAASATFGHLFGANAINMKLFSTVTNTNRTYASVSTLDQDTMNARIWLGLHFRRAMRDGNALGHQAADWTYAHQFRPSTT